PAGVTAVRVVRNLEGAFPGSNGVSLCPQFSGSLGVVLQHLCTGERVSPTVNDGRREVRRWGTGAFKDHIGDLVAVDGHGDGLTTQLTLFTLKVGKPLRNGEGLEDRSSLVDRAVAKVSLERGESRVRDAVNDVHVVCEQVCIRSVLGLVEHKGQAVVLRCTRTFVVRVGDQ